MKSQFAPTFASTPSIHLPKRFPPDYTDYFRMVAPRLPPPAAAAERPSWKYTISRTLSHLLVLWTEWTESDFRMLWLCWDRRIVDTKLVSQALPTEDMPMRRWTDICRQHRYRWKCCRKTPETQYRATGLMHELRKLPEAEKINGKCAELVHMGNNWCVKNVLIGSLLRKVK